jgi:hypothetical protein
MRIKMLVEVFDGSRTLAVDESVETSDEVAADFVARGYAEPVPDDEDKPAEAPRKTRGRSS